MKKLFILSLFLCGSAWVSAEDIQLVLATKAAEEGLIFLRNDRLLEPVEVSRNQMGKYMVCPSADFKAIYFYEVTKDSFQKTQDTVLVRCWNGKLHIGTGYL